MKVVFFGSSQFALPALDALHAESAFDVALVVTETAKRAGRGSTIIHTPVRKKADELGIDVYEPQTLKDAEAQERIAGVGAAVGVLAAYGKIIPARVLSAPEHGIVNIHPSLLPQYRGPSPLHAALRAGETETGVTLMIVDEEIDHGPILSQERIDVAREETYQELEPRLARLGADMVVRDVPQYIDGALSPTPQDHDAATFTAMIKKEDGHVDWTASAEEIYNQWRAFVLWPKTYSFAVRRDARLRIIFTRMRPAEQPAVSHTPGTIFSADGALFVQCGDGVVQIEALQPEGKPVRDAHSFINGYRDILGTVLE